MSSSSSTSVPSFGLWQRAWAASLVFHLTATILVGVFAQRMPRGADLGLGSGMVIELTDGNGSTDTGQSSLNANSETINTAIQLDRDPSADVPPVESIAANFAANLAPLSTVPPADTGASELQSSFEQFTGGGRSGAIAGPTTGPAEPSRGPRANATRGPRFEGIGGGSRSTVELFGVKGTGTKFVYLFDRSSSMEGPPLAAAKRQLVESLRALDSVNQFQIIFFNSRPYPLDITGRGRMAFADERNKKLAANMIGYVTADLGTDRYSALKAAIAYHPDVIFFLTDADDAMPAREVSDIVRQNERIGAMICVIEFGRESAPPVDNFLKQLARESGGQYGYVNAAAF